MNKKTFKKIDIVKKINIATGLPVSLIKEIINDYLIMLIYKIKNDKSFTIKNFGSFKIKDKKKRIGRNPKTKEEYNISSRNVITFKASKILLKYINNNIND